MHVPEFHPRRPRVHATNVVFNSDVLKDIDSRELVRIMSDSLLPTMRMTTYRMPLPVHPGLRAPRRGGRSRFAVNRFFREDWRVHRVAVRVHYGQRRAKGK
jgi:hypothetical protein